MTGLEPATFGVTGRRSNQLSYTPAWARLYRCTPKASSAFLSQVLNFLQALGGQILLQHVDQLAKPGVNLPTLRRAPAPG